MSKKVKLKDIATYINGKAFKPTEWQDSGLPIVRIQNLTGENKAFNYFDGEIDDKYILNNGDLLISWSATLDIYEWNRGEAVLNQHIFKVLFNKNIEVDKNFFKLAIKNVLHNLERFAHGSTMKHIIKKDFDNFEINLPPLEKQNQIAKTLDKANELIELRKESITKLDALAKSIFIDMFGDPVSNSKGWEIKKIIDLGKVQTGNTPPRVESDNYGDFIEWIKSDNILKDKMIITEAREYLSEKGCRKGRIADKGSLLFTCIAGSMSSIGNLAMTDRQVTFNQQINSLTPVDNNELYLYSLFKLCKKFFEENSTKSMKIMINKSTFENLLFPIAPLDLQNKFAKIIEKIEEQKALYEKELELLQNNLDALLQKSFQE